MIWYIADTHFDHTNIMRYCHRPFDRIEDMNQAIIERWNEKVAPNDEIYILGDFCFGNMPRAQELLRMLHGKKYLIKGNHDHWLTRATGDVPGIQWIRQLTTINDAGRVVVLCHYPLESWDRKYHGSYHIYGHVHNTEAVADIPRRFNAGVDVTNFEPMTLDEFIARDAAKLKFDF